jgi:tRNA-dihydrouridine synthase 2
MTAHHAMQSLLRISKSVMTSSPVSLSPTSIAPHVPIPKNGIDYRNKIVLAPMVRSGELPSRLLALNYGADLVWGPETVDKAMIGTTRRVNPRTSCIEWTRFSSNGGRVQEKVGLQKENVIYRIDPQREKAKLVYQIGTSDPELAVQAAKLVAGDVAGIDVNAGCPKPFSTSGGMGAALLRTPDKLAGILEALVEQVGKVWEIGISVKIRLLETPQMTEELVRRLCKTGITGLTIHCRTTPMRPRERAIRDQLRMIGQVCKEHGVACLMNGDVKDRDEGVALAKEYGVDGGMIATAAEANSSAFRTKAQGGLAPWREVVTEYLKLAMSVENKVGNTKFLLSQLMPGKDPLYQSVQMSKSYQQCCEVLGMDEGMIARAKEVDEILGLDAQGPKQQQQQPSKKNKNKRVLEAGTNGRPKGAVNSKKHKAQEQLDLASCSEFGNLGQAALAV